MKTPGRIALANLPTPVQKRKFSDCDFLIKRDDLTGLEMSGNKIRKLEYLLHEAKRKKANIVFTCGGIQSNHSRATAVAAASMGIKSRLYLWGKEPKNFTGNILINKVVNADLKYITRREYGFVDQIMHKDAVKLEKKGKRVIIIPEGGSTSLGIWGYIHFINELKKQTDLRKTKGILLAAGSGGTAAGLIVGVLLNKLNIKIFGVTVLYEKDLLIEKINNLVEQCIKDYKLDVRPDLSNLEILDGYSSEGYTNITDEKITVIKDFASQNGILLDPAYTGKAFYAYNENFLEGKKKTNVMFVHTGGIYGIFPKRKRYLI